MHIQSVLSLNMKSYFSLVPAFPLINLNSQLILCAWTNTNKCARTHTNTHIFICFLYFMYCISRIRMEGLGKIAWFLANEEDSMRKLPLFSDLDVTNLTNILLVDPQRSLLDEDTEPSVFTVSSNWCAIAEDV